MQRTRARFAMAVAVAAMLPMAVSACSTSPSLKSGEASIAPASSIPPPPTRQAAGIVDCGSDPAEASREKVMMVNRTATIVRVYTSAIDCYDWGGTGNPSRFDGLQLDGAVSSTNETLVVRDIPQANTQIRPWDMEVQMWGGTQWLTAKVTPRPTFGAAKGTCNTVKGSTACIGISLCPGPDYLERRVEVPLSSGFGTFTDSGRKLIVTTYCSLSDNQARMVLTQA